MIRLFKWIAALWKSLLVDQWNELQKEIDHSRIHQVQLRGVLVVFVVALLLTVQEYYGFSGSIFYRWFIALLPKKSIYSPMYPKIFWAVSCCTVYFVLPALIILLTPGERLRDYGLSLQGFFRHMWIYVLLYLIVLPAVVVVSYTAPFQRTYPFYHLAPRSLTDLLLWELCYGVQFFCLEFFFRGYMLHGLKRFVGAYSIFFMVVPYCMIHYGKPLPETLGAIIAGTVLGVLSLRTGSIWSGFLIHISVAYSMDILSLWQKGAYSIFH